MFRVVSISTRFFLNKHVTLLGSTLHGSMNNKSNVRRILFTTEIPILFLFFSQIANCFNRFIRSEQDLEKFDNRYRSRGNY